MSSKSMFLPKITTLDNEMNLDNSENICIRSDYKNWPRTPRSRLKNKKNKKTNILVIRVEYSAILRIVPYGIFPI